jgi:hypothetical protein
MKIKWNEVTWYSKMLALAVFIIVPIVAFWFGVGYGELAAMLTINNGNSAVVSAPSAKGSTAAEYYSNVSEWQSYHDVQGGFAIAYPIDFPNEENYSPALSTDWRVTGNLTPGKLGFTLSIPASFEPQTNFADAKLTVGWSNDAGAVAQCMMSDPSGPNQIATSSVTINNANFTIFHSTGAGAGNFYETTSYRTLHTGRCYALEYTIHSSQIDNYPASYNLHPVDEKILTDVLDRIVGTFKFQ